MLNQLINVFWTIIAFGATGHYWGQYFAEQGSLSLVYFFIIVSVLAYNVPATRLTSFTLSTNPRIYELIGIRVMRWGVQDGTLVSHIHRRFGKKHRTITNSQTARAYLQKIAMQERFHYSCFVFFALSSGSAFETGRVWMALLIAFWNILYNVYPVLLQQYNRLRIRKILDGAAVKAA